MTELGLTKALREYLGGVLVSWWGMDAVRSKGSKKPVVIDGYLPPKRTSEGDDYPFVIVRPVKGAADDDSCTCTVQIAVGVLDADSDGYGTALEMVRTILNGLMTLKDRRLDDRYNLSLPVSWEVPQEQPYPAWVGMLTTVWSYPAPQLDFSDTEEIYGYLR